MMLSVFHLNLFDYSINFSLRNIHSCHICSFLIIMDNLKRSVFSFRWASLNPVATTFLLWPNLSASSLSLRVVSVPAVSRAGPNRPEAMPT